MNKPRISVLMPVYNAAPYLKETLKCLLNQSYDDFELLALNDGSKDNSLSILESIDDKRLIIINSEENKGLVWQLNKGIELAKGEFIIRMDSDDTCTLNRFQKQVNFMDSNPEIGICGSYVKVFGNENWNWRMPVSDAGIRFELLIGACFAHNSIIIRKSILENNKLKYRTEAFPVEDYDMWLRIIKHTKAANIPEFLTTYRIYGNQVTSNHTSKKDTLLKNTSIKSFESTFFSLDNHLHLFDIFRGKNKLTDLNRKDFLQFVKKIEDFNTSYIKKKDLVLLLDRLVLMRYLTLNNRTYRLIEYILEKRSLNRIKLILKVLKKK